MLTKLNLGLLSLFSSYFNTAEALSAVNIDGGWSPWSTRTSECFASPNNPLVIVTCGTGFSKRSRSCTNPSPQGGGSNCSGSAEEWLPCNTQLCKLPEGLFWSDWSPCSVQCGPGLRTRFTLCGTLREKIPDVIKTISNLKKPTTPMTTTAKPLNTTSTTNSNTSMTTSRVSSTTTSSGISSSSSTSTLSSTSSSINSTTTTTTTTSKASTSSTSASRATSTTSSLASSTSTLASTSTSTITTTLQTTSIIQMNPNLINSSFLGGYQIEYEETCSDVQYIEETEYCDTWNITECDDPCLTAQCPFASKCINLSNSTLSDWTCICQLGLVMKDDGSVCILPPPTTSTNRPIPSLGPATKVVVTIITRSASFVLIGFVTATIIIFALMKVPLESSRAIHLNIEISLLCAHLTLLPAGIYSTNPDLCNLISIATHFFFTACFIFIFLETVHLYSLVGWVVKKDGLLNGLQNTVIGWCCALTITLFSMAFSYDSYGGDYHCWLQMDTDLAFEEYVPIVVLVITSLTVIEAAGTSEDGKPLENVDEVQRTTAKVMQRSVAIILPLVFASFILGTLADFYQNVGLYFIFTIVNGILGGLVFFFHCSANEMVRKEVGIRMNRLFKNKSQDQPNVND